MFALQIRFERFNCWQAALLFNTRCRLLMLGALPGRLNGQYSCCQHSGTVAMTIYSSAAVPRMLPGLKTQNTYCTCILWLYILRKCVLGKHTCAQCRTAAFGAVGQRCNTL